MQMSKQGLQLLTQWEGSRTQAYADVGGKETIGVGHLLTASELRSGTISIQGQHVNWRNGLTATQVTALLQQDLATYEQAVNDDVHVTLTQNQFDALVSFTYNEGTASLATSTLLKDVNSGDLADVPAQFMRWTKVGSKTVQGLVNRRANEVKLWNGDFGTGADAAQSPTPSPRASTGSPASTVRAPNPQRATQQSTYTVQPGDTLASVATSFNVTVADLADVNGLINPADFKPGYVAKIPR